jgi:hypothetical protein
MLIDCTSMEYYRQSCEIGPFINAYKQMQPSMSSVKLMSLYLSDLPDTNIKNKALSLYHMKQGWHYLMGIN